MASKIIYWTSDGGGADSTGKAAQALHAWIIAQGDADLIVYGGDVYNTGTAQDFADFGHELGDDFQLFCHTPGNHDWMTTGERPNTGRIPTGYEDFWAAHPEAQGKSRQPIDTAKQGGARYEHVIDDGFNGWSLIFLDTGRIDSGGNWPFTPAEAGQVAWLKNALVPDGRKKILFSHHSRLSWGLHGDNKGLDGVWKMLFKPTGEPAVAFTLAGHNHNVSIYKPRNSSLKVTTDPNQGIQMLCNGAGGFGHYPRNYGTPPEIYPVSAKPKDDPVVSSVVKIELADTEATVTMYDFGDNPVKAKKPKATPLFKQTYPV